MSIENYNTEPFLRLDPNRLSREFLVDEWREISTRFDDEPRLFLRVYDEVEKAHYLFRLNMPSIRFLRSMGIKHLNELKGKHITLNYSLQFKCYIIDKVW